MNNLNIEKHFLKNQSLLPAYLAQSLLSHVGIGKAAVITPTPLQLLKSTKEEWLKLTEYTKLSLSFTAIAPYDLLDADVTFATHSDFLRVPPVCQILYVTCELERQDLYMLTSWMPSKSLVIIYEELGIATKNL